MQQAHDPTNVNATTAAAAVSIASDTDNAIWLANTPPGGY